MGSILPNLAVGLLAGFAASIYAISQGYGLLAGLLIYSVTGQVVLLALVGLDLLKASWGPVTRHDRDSEGFVETFADELADPGFISTR